jgi:hypothetical protein
LEVTAREAVKATAALRAEDRQGIWQAGFPY